LTPDDASGVDIKRRLPCGSGLAALPALLALLLLLIPKNEKTVAKASKDIDRG